MPKFEVGERVRAVSKTYPGSPGNHREGYEWIVRIDEGKSPVRYVLGTEKDDCSGNYYREEDLRKIEDKTMTKTIKLQDAAVGQKVYFKPGETAEDGGCLYVHKNAVSVAHDGDRGYTGYDKDGKEAGSCSGCLMDREFLIKEDGMDNLQVGTLLVNQDGGSLRSVVAIDEDTVYTIDLYDGSGDINEYTLTALREEFHVKGEEPEQPEVKELTLAEVAEKMGIPVEQLRIKE